MSVPFFLRQHGVLGLNARNLLYVRPFNPRKAVAFADDKLRTKAFLSARGIPTARMYARIETRRQLRSFDFSTLPDECVLKPNYGYGGEGIILLQGRKNREFLRQGKEIITTDELREHIEDILDGKFAVNGRSDTAFFEQILVADECFRPLRPAGLPDIRVIVFNLVPVMAMLRIPTAESGGKANVHLGGIGIGIDLGRGVTTYGAQYHGMIQSLPHGQPVAGLTIPHWEEILHICSRIQYITNIGYLAVDITIDKTLGPVLLEVNARAGLMVQVANLAPLRSRLERVKGLNVPTPEKGVLLGRELFGSRPVAAKSKNQRPVIGLQETVEFVGDGITIREACAISVSEDDSTIHPSLVHELQQRGIVDTADIVEGGVRLKATLAQQKLQTLMKIEERTGPRVHIGQRDLKPFLIDPALRTPAASTLPRVRSDHRALDRLICGIDGELSFLRSLRPINLAEERQRAASDPLYNPVFQYPPLPQNVDERSSSLAAVTSDGSPLSTLLYDKAQETLQKIAVLRARGTPGFQHATEELFGSVDAELLRAATAYLTEESRESKTKTAEALLTAEQAEERFIAALRDYGLHEWQVERRASLVSDCAVGKRKIFLREGATFSEVHILSLIAHEIEVHVLTTENAAIQPYEIFRRGFAGYTETQEGLAIWNQQRVVPAGHEKRRRHAENVLAADVACRSSFADVRTYLRDTLGYPDALALSKAINLKRGLGHTDQPGCFTRTLTYHRGFRAIQAYREAGKPEKDLYIGKISLPSLPAILSIEGVKPPLLLPVHLRPVKVKTQGSGS